jgi:hydroxymethylpyrimidine/phosphomethylpyrimidine kinase
VKRILVIAGSDSSGGAGIQADIKTAQAFGVYAQTAITAITVQNTLGVTGAHLVPADVVRAQIVACLSDIGADAIKTGMLGSAEMVAMVADTLAEHAAGIPLVVDPVMVAKGGSSLLDQEAVAVIKKRLLRLATLTTPNLPEAEALTGILPVNDHRLRNAAMVFKMLGAPAVLFKGGHGDGAVLRDVLWDGADFVTFTAARQDSRNTHGTGCTMATAIACGLAQGLNMVEATTRAHAYVQDAIRAAPDLGQGHGPLNHQRHDQPA